MDQDMKSSGIINLIVAAVVVVVIIIISIVIIIVISSSSLLIIALPSSLNHKKLVWIIRFHFVIGTSCT